MDRTTYPTKTTAWTRFKALPGIVRFGVLLALVILAMVALPLQAQAEMVYEDSDGDMVRVLDTACPADIAVRAQEGQRGYFKEAVTRMGGRYFRACALPASIPGFSGPQVYLIYEDGDQGVIPNGELKPVQDI